VQSRVVLTRTEARIFDTLRAVCKHYALNTTVRVAGGWVRDKILGRASDDIDLALDDMMGADFARLVNKYVEANGGKCRSVGVIKANPEASKHLETATFRLFGLSIDVNNLYIVRLFALHVVRVIARITSIRVTLRT
jgi:tRNA nucleotidyltransferase (CCA-adding enzyme)